MSGEHPGIESAADGFGEGIGDDDLATFDPTPAELTLANVVVSGVCCKLDVSAVFRTMGPWAKGRYRRRSIISV